MTSTESIAQAVPAIHQLLATFDRTDLADRVIAAGARVNRPGTIVCVVGEFKQGKSSLVNALVRRPVCPVDDDLATAVITLVRHGDQPAAAVHRRDDDGKLVAEAVALEQVVDWASEQGNPGNEKGIERVDIALPSKLLEGGLIVVDTPGMGGVGSGHTAATLAFLPFADGLILVSDSSAELSAPEMGLIKQATERCPTVMLAQTKTDLYPAWEQIYERNLGHLARAGLEIPTVAVSADLRAEAIRTKDRDLNAESHVPELVDVLQKRVIAPARSTAGDRSARELRGVAGLLRAGAAEELRLVEHPEELEQALAALERSKERLEHLRGPGARWSTVLGDRISDLSTSVTHRFRSDMRTIGRSMDEAVEQLTKGSDWEEVMRGVQTEVSEATSRAYADVQQGWVDIHQEIADVLRDEDLAALDADADVRRPLDLDSFWQGTEAVQKDERQAVQTVRSLIGVGQTFGSSRMLFTSMAGVSKFGVSLGALAAGPVVAGGFVVMGGLKVFDDRKRALATKRQKARQQVRQFIDNVQFEVSNEIGVMIREVQRSLRDEFSDRIKELQTTYVETAERAQADAKRNEDEIAERRAKLQQGLEALDAVDALLEGPG